MFGHYILFSVNLLHISSIHLSSLHIITFSPSIHSIHLFYTSVLSVTFYLSLYTTYRPLLSSSVSLFYFFCLCVFLSISSPCSQAQKCKVFCISPHILDHSHPHCVLLFIPESGRAKFYQLSISAP